MKTAAPIARLEVTELEGVAWPPPAKRLYEFVINEIVGRDGIGWRVGARGPRGETETTVYPMVEGQEIMGASFFRS